MHKMSRTYGRIELIEYSPGTYKWGGSRASGSNSKKPI